MSTSGKPRAKRVRRLNVYAIDLFASWEGSSQQCRLVVATYSQREAAEAVGVTPSYWRNWGGVTGNDREITLASREPGVVLSTPLSHPRGRYRRTTIIRNSLTAGEVVREEHPWYIVDTWGTDETVGCWTEAAGIATARRLSLSWKPGRYVVKHFSEVEGTTSCPQ